MSFYKEWGLIDNPFNSTALPANDLGEKLLTGRETETQQIIRRLHNPPSAVTIEGLNGIGKTSLLNVAIFKSYNQFLNGQTDVLYVPCRKIFQLSPESSIEEFIEEVIVEVAQTLIERSEELKNLGLHTHNDKTALDKWLNSPNIVSFQGGIGTLSAGRNVQFNTTEGFSNSGFRKQVEHWLGEIFPEPKVGGVVCIIDNLELLETSEKARKMFEQLRDSAFNITGLRWAMCGALGITMSIASTPRLAGYLHIPIELKGIGKADSIEMFKKRILYFSNRNDAYIPMTSSCFEYLYEVMNCNLRNTLHYADQFCLYASDQNDLPNTEAEKNALFKEWLEDHAKNVYDSLQSRLKPRSRKLFTDVIARGGYFTPGDFEELGFKSISALRPQVVVLEDVGLVSSTVNENDNRRKTIQITPKGYLASYAIGKL